MIHPPEPPVHTTRAAGFSLVEIVVVIAIITLLIALGLVGLDRVRAGAEAKQTRVILQALANASTEYQARMGEAVDHEDEAKPAGMASVAWFVYQIVGDDPAQPRVPEANEMLQPLNAHRDGNLVRDTWDTPIEYREQSDGSDQLPAHHRPFFASAGPDGTWGTDDDLYSFDLD